MPADRIKGITIQIGGDVKPLNEALESANKTIATTQKDLKDVQRLLKLDPKNAEMLTQKQQSLAKAIEATKEKLKTLKEAERQAQEQFKQGKMSEEQYKALQREIAETEGNLKSLQKAADEATVKLGKGIQSAGKKVSEFGKKLDKVSLAAGTMIGAGLKIAVDFEAGMSEVQAITQATESELEKLKEVAIDLGASTAFSSKEVAAGMVEMGKAGWSASQIIEGMEGILDAAAASGEELSTVSTIVADAITGFGLSASDSTKIADLFTQAANAGTISISDLGETMKYVSSLGQTAGFSIEDVTTAISAMATASIKGSQAGTSLRSFVINLINPSEEAAIAMERLGLETTNADGTFKSLDEILAQMRKGLKGMTDEQKASTIAAITGKYAYSGIQAVLNLTQEEYDQLSAKMKNSSGVADQTAAIMQDNLKNALEQLGGALESLAIALSETVIPWLTEVIRQATEWVEKFIQMDSGTQNLILTLLAAATAASPLLRAIGGITQGIGGIISIFPTIKGGFTFLTGTALPAATKAFSTVASTIQGAVTSAFSTLTGTVLPAVGKAFSSVATFIVSNPIAAILAAVAALVIAIGTKGDEIQAYLQKLDNWLQGVFAKDWTETFGPVMGSALNALLTATKELWDGLKRVLDGIIDFIRGVFTGDWERAWSGIKDIFGGVFDGIESIARNVIGSIQNLIDGIGNAIDWVWDKLSNLSFDLPDWDIPFFADGGTLTRGKAIVGEAGPELLTVQNGRAVVQPLTGPHAHPQITQNNYFTNYQPRDGAAAVRDLNRQLGWEY